MKPVHAFSLFISFATAIVIPRADEAVSYDGYKVFRVATGSDLAAVEEKLAPFSVEPWNRDTSQHMDIALRPDQIEEFEALGLDVTVMHQDLGADIASESLVDEPSQLSTRQAGSVPNANWFNNYHAYNDHIQFLRDLQAAFPNQSEIVTAGSSVQGRALTGIHLWGSGGKGSRPAILWHGTV